jgi:phosphatidyl-myo-inositol dimannoside synthase
MPRRRVLLLTPDFPPVPGGIQLLLHRAAIGLAEHHDVHVVTLAAPGDEAVDTALPGGLRVRRVPRPRLAGQVGDVALLDSAAVAEAVRLRPDVVLSGHLVTAPAALALRRLLGVPYLQYVYCDEMPHRPGLARRALRGAALVLALGEYAGSLAREHGAPAERVRLVPPGVDSARITGTPRHADPLVVTVARIADLYKGHDVAVRALPLVAARVPRARWAFVGDGPLRERHQATARALGVADQALFCGAVGDAEREAWLDRGHVFALPSRPSGVGGGEGYGLVYLEAGTHGLPCVGGDRGGATDAVVDGLTGLLVDALDHVAVADAVATLLLDPARAQAMGRAGAQRAARLTWAAMAARLAELIDDVALSRAAA